MTVATNTSMAKLRRKPNGSFPPDTAAPQSAGDTTAAVADRERIATRAYELYLARGRGEGQELDDWLSAERELNGDSSDRDDEA